MVASSGFASPDLQLTVDASHSQPGRDSFRIRHKSWFMNCGCDQKKKDPSSRLFDSRPLRSLLIVILGPMPNHGSAWQPPQPWQSDRMTDRLTDSDEIVSSLCLVESMDCSSQDCSWEVRNCPDLALCFVVWLCWLRISFSWKSSLLNPVLEKLGKLVEIHVP